MKTFQQYLKEAKLDIHPNPDDKDKWSVHYNDKKIGHISRLRDNANKTYYKINGVPSYNGERTHRILSSAKNSIKSHLTESVEQQAQLWVKGYKSEEEALRTIRNIKDEILHIISNLTSINGEAVDMRDKLRTMSQVEFSKWVVSYFTNDLKKAKWPESHSKELNDIIRNRVSKPLLAHKNIL